MSSWLSPDAAISPVRVALLSRVGRKPASFGVRRANCRCCRRANRRSHHHGWRGDRYLNKFPLKLHEPHRRRRELLRPGERFGLFSVESLSTINSGEAHCVSELLTAVVRPTLV